MLSQSWKVENYMTSKSEKTNSAIGILENEQLDGTIMFSLTVFLNARCIMSITKKLKKNDVSFILLKACVKF